ncbi:MAG: hypothetical protein ACOY45_05825 [Pseudomonadota bacterium]
MQRLTLATPPARPQLRGYRVSYRPGTACPGCGGTAWHVGRHSAECAACSTALPLAPADGPRAPAERLPAWAMRP